MSIQASEISAILKEQIKNFGQEAEVSEVGRVLSVGDGIARVYGLDQVQAGEIRPAQVQARQIGRADGQTLQGQARLSGGGRGCGDAGNDFKRDPGRNERGDFFFQAAKEPAVAGFQAHDAQPGFGVINDGAADMVLFG